MPTYLFRIEAVNLDPSVYDTSDISTIRGAGFYLLNAVHLLTKQKLGDVITEGASAAVFKITTDDPEEKRQEIFNLLYDGKDSIQEMTLLVEYLPYDDKKDPFNETMAALQGKLRLKQMQAPDIKLMDYTLTPKKRPDEPHRFFDFDHLNRVLPAHTEDPRKRPISSFTAKRKAAGIKLRHEIYKIILEEGDKAFPIEDYDFTNDLEELCTDPRQGNLNHKIAFIYIDGNKFGPLQQKLGEKKLQKFDQDLKEFKAKVLGHILRLCRQCPSFLSLSGDQIRLETLLWGGDELKLVVPAWMGWRVAQCFFETAAALNPKIDTPDGAPKELTYAMGMVLAHHKNPIRNIGRIAEDLADAAKTAIDAIITTDGAAPQYRRGSGDRMHYVVLESIESLPGGYEGFAETYYHAAAPVLCLTPPQMKLLDGFGRRLDKSFARSKTYEVACAWQRLAEKPDKKEYLDIIKRGLATSEASPDDRKLLKDAIFSVTGADPETATIKADHGYRWLQVSELWDYLPKEEII